MSIPSCIFNVSKARLSSRAVTFRRTFRPDRTSSCPLDSQRWRNQERSPQGHHLLERRRSLGKDQFRWYQQLLSWTLGEVSTDKAQLVDSPFVKHVWRKTYSATHQVTFRAKLSFMSRFSFILDVWVCEVLQNTGRRSRAERRHGLQIPLILLFGILKHGHVVGVKSLESGNMSEILN